MQRTVLRRLVSDSGSNQSTAIPDNNLLRLKRISQSFEDLTSETLYGKWKKARKSGTKADRRDCSISLSSLAEEKWQNSRNGNNCRERITAADLQRQLFRPRGWTVCNGQISRDAEAEIAPNNSAPFTDSLSDDAESLSSAIDADTFRKPIAKSSDNLQDEVFSASSTVCLEQIETKKHRIIDEIIAGTALKSRSISDSDHRIIEGRPITYRKKSDPTSLCRLNSETRARSMSCREPREIEFLCTSEMAQKYLGVTSIPREDIWQKRSCTGDLVAEGRHKRMPHTSVIHARSEVNNNCCNIQEASLGIVNDRSQPDARKRYNLGSTCALISQPQPQMINSYPKEFPIEVKYQDQNHVPRQFLNPAMSESSAKESRSIEDKERDDRTVKFQEGEFVCDFTGSQMAESSHHGVRRVQTLPRMPKRPLASLTSRNWKESELKTRKAAEDLIQHMNNSNEKTAQERVDIVEMAFEWIRKEVADLRAQDKDIMRMFTKIQAGIRTIKFDQSSLMESEEEYISTPDLSSGQAPLSGGVHRRASLR